MKVSTPKPLEFKTKLTGKVFVLSALPICSALILLFFAMDAASKFDPSDSARIPFVGGPMVLALILLTVVAATLNHFLRREVRIEDDFLIYHDPKTELHLEIAKMAYSAPAERGFLKVLMFSDGETFVQFPEIFMGDKEFSQLTEAITTRRRKARSASRDTYSL